MSWPTHHWHLHSFWTPLCNHWTLWFPYLHPRPLCLTLSNLTLLSLVLQLSCMHQNSWAPTISNSVLVFWTFRLTSQNLQKLVTCPTSLLSITNLLMFSAKLKLKLFLLIIFMTSKSIWKKVFYLWLALYTLFQYLNKKLWKNSLRKILTCVSSNQPHLCTIYQSYSLRKKMVHYASMSTSAVLTTSPRRIAIYSYSSLIYWTHLAKLGSTQR